MTHAHVDDLHEGWGLGAPELEIHTFLKQVTTEWTDEWCAGENHPMPVYNWNMDGHYWYGEVWLVTENKIGETQVQFQIWENDAGPFGMGDDPCTSSSGMPPNTKTSINNALFDLSTQVVNIYLSPPDTLPKYVSTAIGLIRPVFSVFPNAFHDDFVGLLESPPCWPLPDQGRPVFSIVDENAHPAGYAHVDVNYGIQEPMCPPTPVPPEVSITSFSIDSYEFLMQVSVNDSTNSVRVDRQLDGGAWTFVENRNIAAGSSAGLYVTHSGVTGQRAGVRLTPYTGSNGTGDDGLPEYRWADVP